MKVIDNEQVIFFDVDDTLVMWHSENKFHPEIIIQDPYDKELHNLKKHLGHIKVLKDRKERGAMIIVWSNAGYKWAKVVITALNLESYVDYIMTKPFMYVDDLEAPEVLGNRLYLGKDSIYGTKNKKGED